MITNLVFSQPSDFGISPPILLASAAVAHVINLVVSPSKQIDLAFSHWYAYSTDLNCCPIKKKLCK